LWLSFFIIGYAIDFERLQAAHVVVKQARAALEAIFKQVDVLLALAAKGQAPKGLDATGDPLFGRIWSALGNPGLTLPQGSGNQGLSLGVLLCGPYGQDRAFLQAAQHLESLLAE
jgi:amidase